MIQLLEGEEILADLRRGLLQRLSTDMLELETIILTSKRLVFVRKKMGSFTKLTIFLREVQGCGSYQHFSVALALLSGFCGILALLFFANSGGSTGPLIMGFVFLACAVSVLPFLQTNAVRVSTPSNSIVFRLSHGLETKKIEEFLDLVQRQVAQLKQI
ncbi:MAG: hypothetical protein IH602_17970 [Bryobacteraceae bacterium]|nr:hypothetical protein [Bryobacteraceae bacterium]